MRFSKKKIVILNAILMVALIGGVLAYSWYQNRAIGNIGTIAMYDDLQVYNEASCQTIMTQIDWGNQVHRNTNYSKLLWVKNIGEEPIQIAWNVTGVPTNITMVMRSDGIIWQPNWDSTYNAGQIIACNLTMALGNATYGALSFTVNIYGFKT